jgi:glyoxylase-like metal-dependent hydrolase (beta-lactamase superfamily II)
LLCSLFALIPNLKTCLPGDVAKIYPSDAKEQDILQNKTKRVEIFKMPSGTDYVLHDIDENNIIVGKARFAGNVRVNEGISVIGLDDGEKTSDNIDSDLGGKEEDEVYRSPNQIFSKSDQAQSSMSLSMGGMPSTFSPPSFGLTVLGNSHGFDKSGSTSGYVLWINGRGVMIDPPPYSSATLEREGIRSRTIVGIILTHCHADHDAGAFQKVLAGSPVVVITTPTIYKSFIRKYAALSSLKPAILRQSHRFKPAIIGEPLRFQGATFHFTYTLHSIPCVGFKVDWRGRSMVFTGDHFNNPPALQALVEKGVLSKARCADLNHLPLQDTDLLLHESGAPPIHTPLDVLLKLPAAVKRRLYVVHTSALPEGCELKVAPTGTAGTIRLDQIRRSSSIKTKQSSIDSSNGFYSWREPRPSIFESTNTNSFLKYGRNSFTEHMLEDVNEYAESELLDPSPNAYDHILGEVAARLNRRSSTEPPPVSLRPTSSSDAWFILNLLSAVPFLSDLSYSSTMEVLETARVVAFCCNEIVLPASRRDKQLVVVWEGACMEMESESRTSGISTVDGKGKAVWYAGDWTGPRILQPEKRLSGDSSSSRTHDIVAMSADGVKVRYRSVKYHYFSQFSPWC